MATSQPQQNTSNPLPVPENHILINYRQPPEPDIVNNFLEIIASITRTFAQHNPSCSKNAYVYVAQLWPHLHILYDQSMVQALMCIGAPTISPMLHIPPALRTHQQLVKDLKALCNFSNQTEQSQQ